MVSILFERPWSVLGGTWCGLEVWGDPWASPGMSECCYVVCFRLLSEMSCYKYLEAMSFS